MIYSQFVVMVRKGHFRYDPNLIVKHRKGKPEKGEVSTGLSGNDC
jgi:hypothetical protein